MKLTDKEILEYNNLITEFRGYVYVGKSIFLHSSRGLNRNSWIDGFVHESQLSNKFDFYKDLHISGVGKIKDNKELTEIVLDGINNNWYFTAICNHSTNLDYVRNNLKYNESFEWIMLVVEHIEKLDLIDEFNICYDSVAKGNWVQITPAFKDTFNTIHTEVYEKKIDAIYDAVIQFIKWYNQNIKLKK
jgi:hypothetical protein